MKVAAIQYDIAWADPEANFEQLADRIGAAADAGADLVLLPETFSTGFGFGTAGFPVETEGGPSATFLSSQADRHRVWIAGSCPEISPNRDPRPANTAVFAAPDGTQYRYRKVHPFSFGDEDRYVRPGNELLNLRIGDVRVSPFICYDLRFATEFWQLAPETDLYVVVANWPAARRQHWLTLLRARAIENLAYLVGVNRIGAANGLEYAGDTIAFDPVGEILADAADQDTTVFAEIDPAVVQSTRDRFGFLNDRTFHADRTLRAP